MSLLDRIPRVAGVHIAAKDLPAAEVVECLHQVVPVLNVFFVRIRPIIVFGPVEVRDEGVKGLAVGHELDAPGFPHPTPAARTDVELVPLNGSEPIGLVKHRDTLRGGAVVVVGPFGPQRRSNGVRMRLPCDFLREDEVRGLGRELVPLRCAGRAAPVKVPGDNLEAGKGGGGGIGLQLVDEHARGGTGEVEADGTAWIPAIRV